jgi:hypothetical protein
MELYVQVPVIVLGQSGIYSGSVLLWMWLTVTSPLQQQLTVHCQLGMLYIGKLFGYKCLSTLHLLWQILKSLCIFNCWWCTPHLKLATFSFSEVCMIKIKWWKARLVVGICTAWAASAFWHFLSSQRSWEFKYSHLCCYYQFVRYSHPMSKPITWFIIYP